MAKRYKTFRNPSIPVRIQVHPYTNVVYFCANEKAWKKVTKDWNPVPAFSDNTSGTIVVADDGKHIAVKITPFAANDPLLFSVLADVISHESMHVVQTIKAYIEEKDMSEEAEAYLIGHIVRQLVVAWVDTNLYEEPANETAIPPVDVTREGPAGEEEPGGVNTLLWNSPRNTPIATSSTPRKLTKRRDYY